MEKSEINKIIKEELSNLFEDIEFNYNKTYYPPQNVINNCKKALDIVKNNNLLDRGGNEGSGIKKAQTIINKEPLTHSMIKRMKSFFDNNQEGVNNLKNKGKNINNSPEIQKWELWGGKEGMIWVSNEISKFHSNNMKSKKLKRDSGIQKTSTIMDPHNTRIKK